jgi:hypothetical protein
MLKQVQHDRVHGRCRDEMLKQVQHESVARGIRIGIGLGRGWYRDGTA